MKCWCGNDLHYKDKKLQAQIEEIIRQFGANMVVIDEQKRSFLVQRHFIALHGIRGKDLAKLGFERVNI